MQHSQRQLLPNCTIRHSPQLGTMDPIYAFSADNASFGAEVLLLSSTWHHDTVLEQLLHRCSVCEPANENSMSKHCQFGSALSCTVLLRLVRGTQQRWTLAREKCNKYDLTTIPCFWLANHMDCSRWCFLWIVSYPLKSQYQFYGRRLEIKVNN
jgi:hypothetical protein